jgi:hypothetical protein
VSVESLKELEKAIEEAKIEHEHAMDEWMRIDRMNNAPRPTEVRILEAEYAFQYHSIDYDYRGNAIFLVNDWFYYAATTGRWRHKEGSVWYRSKNIKDFIFRYVIA